MTDLKQATPLTENWNKTYHSIPRDERKAVREGLRVDVGIAFQNASTWLEKIVRFLIISNSGGAVLMLTIAGEFIVAAKDIKALVEPGLIFSAGMIFCITATAVRAFQLKLLRERLAENYEQFMRGGIAYRKCFEPYGHRDLKTYKFTSAALLFLSFTALLSGIAMGFLNLLVM